MHRLRDLPGRARVVAVVVALCLTAPFAASVVRAAQLDWTPSNDEALITIRAHDVVAGELPLIGQPSTAAHYSDLDPPNHPGPIEFYLLVLPVQALGSDLGVLIGAGLFNLAAVLVAAWVIFRRAGPLPGLLGALLLSGLAWAQGLAVLTDPISSNLGGIPLVALAVIGWAVLDGDVPLLPLWAFAFAFVCQQHLAVVGVAAGIAGWTVLGLGLTWVGWRRAGVDSPHRWRWLAGAGVVSLVAWLPVLVDQFFGSGNISRMISFARSSDRPSLGLAAGLRQGLRALGMPPLIARTNLHGDEIHASMSVLAVVGSLLVIGALVAIAVRDRGRCRPRATLAITALLVAAFGAVTGSNVPRSMEADRINFYRWTYVASALAWLVLAWAAAGFARRRWPEVAERMRVPACAAALVALAVIAASTIWWSGPQARRDQEVFAAEHRLASSALAALERHAPKGSERILLVPRGSSATLAIAPSLALQLIEAGYDVSLPPDQVAGYGDHLVADGEPVDVGLVLATGKDGVEDGPGKVLVRIDLNEANRAARARLAAQLQGRDLEVSDRGPEIIREVAGDSLVSRSELFEVLLASVGTDAANALQFPEVARAIDAGYFVDADVDQGDLDTLLRHPVASSWAEDVIELRSLSWDELEAAYPEQAG